jgi:hypothetical protein
MDFKITHNAGQVTKAIEDLAANALPLVASIAVDNVARATKAAVQEDMARVFDRPTRFTLGSLKLTLSKNKNARAFIGFKGAGEGYGGRVGQDPTEWRGPQVTEERRAEKRSEYLMRQAGVLLPGYWAVPGAGAKLDQNGNITRGQMQQILSAVGAQFDAPQRTSKRTKNRVTRAIFAIPRAGMSLPPGVYQRVGFRAIPLLRFVRQPVYRKRLAFEETAQRVMRDRYATEFRLALNTVALKATAKALA